ncbi:MAG: fumarylacetoacetate hydrolase family protein [Ignavibacteria bacterium]|nr:fumarylacetoacetate hydrolase family protein [Ignavibacteria bacterium]
MKLVTYSQGGQENFGMLVAERIVNVSSAFSALASEISFESNTMPPSMLEFLKEGELGMNDALKIETYYNAHPDYVLNSVPLNSVTLLAPVPKPTSMRDGYAFRQHVASARKNRGLEMIPEYDEIPIFYFTNHMAVFGGGPIEVRKMHCDKLDFELEGAIVIGKEGRDISAADADQYVAGYTIMNDWSARTMQMHEMKLNLGPAKGKDFATSIGPWLVTRDELHTRIIQDQNGERFDLEMKAFVNGIQVSAGNMKDMTWTFAQIIERASYGVTLYPGDVIGSGTCGTGCFLELNGSKVYEPAWWLKPGDEVTCTIDMLGSLENNIVLSALDVH